MTNSIQNIITKTIVKPFYKQHVIILGLVYLIMFGAVRGDQLLNYHLKLIEGTVTSYGAMLLVFCIWLIYFIRCTYFLKNLVHKKENYFIKQLTLLNKELYKKYVVQLVITCFLPINTYGLCIIAWAFFQGFYVQGLFILLFQTALHLLCYLMLYKNWRNAEMKKVGLLHLPWLNIPKRFLIQFYIKYLFAQQALQWLLIKLVCFVAIKASFFNTTPEEELRFSTFFYCMLFMVHLNLIYQFVQWEYQQLWCSRMLPIAKYKKIASYFLFLFVLIIPELLLISSAYPYNLNGYNTISLLALNFATIIFIFTICISFNNIYANFSPLIGLYLLLVYGFVLSNNLILFSVGVVLVSFMVLWKSIGELELGAGEVG
jgi:hypothetical protein